MNGKMQPDTAGQSTGPLGRGFAWFHVCAFDAALPAKQSSRVNLCMQSKHDWQLPTPQEQSVCLYQWAVMHKMTLPILSTRACARVAKGCRMSLYKSDEALLIKCALSSTTHQRCSTTSCKRATLTKHSFTVLGQGRTILAQRRPQHTMYIAFSLTQVHRHTTCS